MAIWAASETPWSQVCSICTSFWGSPGSVLDVFSCHSRHELQHRRALLSEWHHPGHAIRDQPRGCCPIKISHRNLSTTKRKTWKKSLISPQNGSQVSTAKLTPNTTAASWLCQGLLSPAMKYLSNQKKSWDNSRFLIFLVRTHLHYC